MPNQMIALQARSPQLPDPAAQTAKYVNMMNMTKQQEAAERQAAQAQQAMEFARTGEARAVQTQTATMRDKDLDFQLKDMKRLRNIGVAVLESGNEEAYQDLVGMIEQSDPQFGATIRKVAPTFNAKVLQTILMEADKYIDKTVATPVASLELSVDGSPRSVQVGGPPGTASQSPVYDVPEMGAPPRPAQTPTNPMSRNAPAPNAAGEAPGSLGLVIASALQTRVMSQADLDKMLANVQPASQPKIMNWVRENGINVAPDAPPLVDNQMRDTPMSYDGKTPQSQFAVMRGQPMQSQTAGLSGAPEMQQTMAQTQPRTITKLQQRNPNVSPAPGIYGVPTGQVAATSQAQRETPGEVYAKEKARAKAQREALLEAGPKPLTREQEVKLRDNITKDYTSAQSTIDAMLDPKSGVVAAINAVRRLSQPQKEAVLGYTGYLPTVFPSTRQADTALKNLEGKVTALGKGEASLNGAIGQMAVQEWRIVRDLIASLDYTNMEPADLDRQLDIIEATAMRAAAMAENAYTNQYVEEFARYPGRFQLKKPGGTPTQAAPKAEAQIPRVRGNADYNKLKPGTLFIDPNGERRRKPK